MKPQPLLSLVFLAIFQFSFSQTTSSFQVGDIRQRLEKLNVLGSVLYVAAHPDDENTRMIAYYANHKLMRTAYLSATRGDGGQNLIGPQIREELGLIRTQELQAARRIDGGQQFFSRANDFGYSKNPEETFNIWDRDQVLADFVWAFRKFKPDVIITRFSDTGRSHGHHTASAILAREAFKLSGDPNAYPDQLDYVETWEPKKVFWNTGWWWFRDGSMDTSQLSTIDVGGYDPLLGESYTEVAARSRSMHKSQGFGSSGTRGKQIEYLQQWEGERIGKSPFDGIETSWDRVAGSKEVAFFIQKAIDEYDETNPSEIIGSLMAARNSLNDLQNPFWKEVKLQEIDDLIRAVSGLYVSLSSSESSYAVGDSISLSLEVVNRSAVNMKIDQLRFKYLPNPVSFELPLLNNRPFKTEMKLKIPNQEANSHPYWLVENGTLGMYQVNNQELIGLPENSPAITGEVTISIEGEKIQYEIPIRHKRTDPVLGEVIEPLTIGPPVMVNVSEGVLVFGDKDSKTMEVRVIAGRQKVEGEVSLELPNGWSATPKAINFNFEQKGEEQVYRFEVTPPSTASEGIVKAIAEVGNKKYTKGRSIIDYDHIPKQTLYPESQVKVVRIDLKKEGNLIGYIEGAGDAIPENLQQVGYQVEILEKDDVTTENLKQYDAIILGVRAFNTVEWLSFKNAILFEYVEAGGNLIVQYNTNRRMVTQKIAPFDLQLSRDRVSVEEAPVAILAKDHPVINSPNRITQKDFENWVQERGLYFPDSWSDEFTPILESNDPGESPKTGGLLVAKYGKGYYIYSGYSWFRELPAGVSGAYRLFVNMISLGK